MKNAPNGSYLDELEGLVLWHGNRGYAKLEVLQPVGHRTVVHRRPLRLVLKVLELQTVTVNHSPAFHLKPSPPGPCCPVAARLL